jgi:hypothetical protein
MGEQLERIEDRLLAAPIPEILRELHALKREMLFVRSDLAYMPGLGSR